jgi:hypothetical protein
MSLYLTIFDDDSDVAGWVLGHYSDFGYFRDSIAAHLKSSDYPTFMLHSDCDGEWSAPELPILRRELQSIGDAFRALPPQEPKAAFEHTAEYRTGGRSLYDCFHNVDGENLFEALIALCEEGIRLNKPILFQ